MALTYDQLTAITRKHYIPVVVDNIFKSNPLFWRMSQKGQTLQGGTSIMQPLAYAQISTGGSYSGYDTLDTTATEEITSAEFDWKQYYTNVTLDGLSQLKNSGDAAVIDLLAAKMQIAEHTLRDLLGTGLFSDGTTNSSKVVTGAKAAVDDSSNIDTYGGIQRSVYTWWKSVYDGTTTTLTLPVMQTMDGNTTIDADVTTIIITTQTLYNAYWTLLQPQQRFADDDLAKGGFKNLLFNGKPVVVDSHCTANYMYFLNENYLDFVTHKDRNFITTPFQKPINQDCIVAQIFWAGNLTSSNCRMQGKFIALTG